MYQYLSAIGQDSHRFVAEDLSRSSQRKLRLGGIEIPDSAALEGNSDADVVFHAITNAISGISGVNVLGVIADRKCQEGVTDSEEYLKYALDTLGNDRIVHVSISVECLRPRLSGYIDSMKKNIARVIGIDQSCIGLTATSGEGLTEVGKGMGIAVFSIITVRRKENERDS
jgi:2-C-methyl-D-erythritol 2,4-cyclodiphosphate synthase